MPTDDRWPPASPHPRAHRAGSSTPRPGVAVPTGGRIDPRRPPYQQGQPPPQGQPPYQQGPPPYQRAQPQSIPPPQRMPDPKAFDDHIEGQPEPDDPHPFLTFRKIRSHARKQRVPRWAFFLLILGIAAVGAGLRFVPGSPLAEATTGSSLAKPMPFHSANVTAATVGTEGFLSWAYLDRGTGEIVGSANMADPTDTASMIKAWIAADYLRLAAQKGTAPPADAMNDLTAMIRDSDNDSADRIVAAVGGTNASVGRLITMCQLTESKAVDNAWSNTIISARDTVRMGACIADGRAAGAQWTPFVLDTMRSVKGEGDFGIRKAFPAAEQPSIAIKNGWVLRDEDGIWHTGSLAISDTWVMAVMQRYPSHGNWDTDLAHLDNVCQAVVRQLTAT